MRNAEAVFRSLAGDGFPTLPNDILGVEYLAALSACRSAITPFTYRREEGYSASEARRVLTAGGDFSHLLPENASTIFAKTTLTPTATYDAIALHTLRSTSASTLEACYAMNGGVAGLIKHRAEEATSVEELIALCTSRKFSAARLRRGILAAVLSYTPEQVYTTPRFTRLLGANDKGRTYLAKVRKTTSLPIVTKPADGLTLGGETEQQFEASLRADKLMALVRGEPTATVFRTMPIMI
jgi:predicted nucleotidyltransferase